MNAFMFCVCVRACASSGGGARQEAAILRCVPSRSCACRPGPHPVRAVRRVQAGMCDGMTYEEVYEKMPEEYELRKKDKLHYRCGIFPAPARAWQWQGRGTGRECCRESRCLWGAAAVRARAQACLQVPARKACAPQALECSARTDTAAPHHAASPACRYPSGESYMDVIQRLEPVVSGGAAGRSWGEGVLEYVQGAVGGVNWADTCGVRGWTASTGPYFQSYDREGAWVQPCSAAGAWEGSCPEQHASAPAQQRLLALALRTLAWMFCQFPLLALLPNRSPPPHPPHTHPHPPTHSAPLPAEVERERECVVIVAHQAVLRALYGYFMNRPLEVRAGGRARLFTTTAMQIHQCVAVCRVLEAGGPVKRGFHEENGVVPGGMAWGGCFFFCD